MTAEDIAPTKPLPPCPKCGGGAFIYTAFGASGAERYAQCRNGCVKTDCYAGSARAAEAGATMVQAL